MRYSAFISYSHAADDRLAQAVHSALHRFAKPWFRLRALRIFRDKTSLSVNPALWPSIERALGESEYFILLASPEAAQSRWVLDEVACWLKTHSSETILIVLTAGELSWDSGSIDFRWSESAPLPPNLRGRFRQEPFWLDLRWAKTEEQISLRHPRFREGIARLAATLHNRPLDEISGEDVRQHRTMKRLAWSAMLALTVLTITALVFGILAEKRRREAERQRLLTIAQALAAYAPREQEQGRMDERAALLARQAFLLHHRHHGNRLDQIDRALRQVLSTPYFSVRLSSDQDRPQLTSSALSQDGRWLAVSGNDTRVRLWDLQKPGSAPVHLSQNHGIIRSLTFGLPSDQLFAGAEDGIVVSWKLDRAGNVTAFRELPGHSGRRVLSVAVSPEGDRLASGSEDGRVRVWDLQKSAGEPVILCCSAGEKAVWAVSFHPKENSLLASAGEDNRVLVWDLRRPEAPIRTFEGADNTIKSLVFSPDGREIACGTDRTPAAPSLFDVVKMLDKGQAPTGLSIVGGTVLIWRFEKPDGKAERLGTHEAGVTALAYDRTGEMLASASDDKTIKLWHLRESRASFTVLRGHESSVVSVRFSQDGHILVSVGGGDSSVRLWDMRRPEGAPKYLEGHEEAALSVAFSPDSRMIVSADGGEEGVRLWRVDQGRTTAFLRQPSSRPVSVGYHPSQQIVASGSRGDILDPENTVSLWDPRYPEKPLRVLPHAYKSSVDALIFSGNGEFLASAGRFDQEIVVWSMGQPERPHAVLSTNPPANVSALAFSAGNEKLAAACSDNTVQVWDLKRQTKEPLILRGHEAPVLSVAFMPNGWTLFSGDDSGILYRWDLREPRRRPVMLGRVDGRILSLAMNVAGTSLASGGSDGKVRVWDLVSTASDVRVLPGPGANVYSVAFSPDGQWLAAGGSNRTILVWPTTEALAEMVCERVRRNLSEAEWQQFVGPDIRHEPTCPNLPLTSTAAAER